MNIYTYLFYSIVLILSLIFLSLINTLIIILIILYIFIGNHIYSHPPKTIIDKKKVLIKYIVFMPYAIFYTIFNFSKKQIIICVTIDGDLEQTPSGKKTKGMKKSIQITLNLLKKNNLKGKVTWFINEKDYNWTKNYPNELNKLHIDRYDIQLHSHCMEKEWFKKSKIPKKQLFENDIKIEKEQLEKFMKKIDKKFKITSFRAGKHITADYQYSILKKLGFLVDSSEIPGKRKHFGNKIYFDYTNHNPITNWYFKKEDILELPVYNFIPPLNYMTVVRKSNNNPIILTYLFHPFELISNNGHLNKLKYFTLTLQFFLLKLIFPNAKYCTVSEVNEILKK